MANATATPGVVQRDASGAQQAAVASINAVRRPTCGIQPKRETFATLRVMASGVSTPLVDAGALFSSKEGYTNFLLQQVSEARTEKAQIVETFGLPYIFLYGERPRTLEFSGVLINSFDFNWENEWWANYDTYVRGTRCVENGVRAYIAYDHIVVGGYIIGASATKASNDRNVANLQFQLFVTSYAFLKEPGDSSAVDDPNVNYDSEFEYTVDGFASNPIYSPEHGNTARWSGRPDVLITTSNNDGTTTSLSGSVQSLLNTAQQALRMGFGVTNFIKNSLLYGVRVPYGFAASAAYDEADIRLPVPISSDGVVQYNRKFSDNEAEYLMPGDYYTNGGPTFAAEHGLTDLRPSKEQQTKYGNDMQAKAAAAFGGLQEVQLTPLQGMLAKAAFGVMDFAASKTLQTAMYTLSGTPIGGILFAGAVADPLANSPSLAGPLNYLQKATTAANATVKQSADGNAQLASLVASGAVSSVQAGVDALKNGPPTPSDAEKAISDILKSSSVPGAPGSE